MREAFENPTQRLHLPGMNKVTDIIMRTGNIKSSKSYADIIYIYKKRIKKTNNIYMGHFKCDSWDIISVSQDDKVSCVILKNKNNGESVRLQ